MPDDGKDTSRMKTHTELNAYELIDIYNLRAQLVKKHKEIKQQGSEQKSSESLTATEAEKSEPASTEGASNSENEKSSTSESQAVPTPPLENQQPVSENTSSTTNNENPSDQPDQGTPPITQDQSDQNQPSQDPQTISDPRTKEAPVETSPGPSDKSQAKETKEKKLSQKEKREKKREEIFRKRQEEKEQRKKEWALLVEETKDQLKEKVLEKYKWADERISLAFDSLNLLDRKRFKDFRKILILKPEKEDEPLPKNGVKINDFVFVPHYLPPLEKPKEKSRKPRDKKRKKRDPKNKKRFQRGSTNDQNKGDNRKNSKRPCKPAPRKNIPTVIKKQDSESSTDSAQKESKVETKKETA